MASAFRAILIGGLVAAGGAMTADTAGAQWGYYGYGGPSFSFGFSTGPRYSTYYAPAYGYGYSVGPSYYGTSYGYSTFRPYYGGYYGAPRGRLSYDLYGPYGRSELNYRYYRNGRVRVDFDD